MSGSPKRVREQAVVYLSERDRSLLDDLAEKTGLSRTELFRRGLWALAAQIGVTEQPGSSIDYLVSTASQDDAGPPDLAERADDYLYGGEYQTWLARKEAAVAETKPSSGKRSTKRARPR
ncbi:MAG TPA: hypothetical protein VI259_06185 [Gemmatimonadaceae bacterium]